MLIDLSGHAYGMYPLFMILMYMLMKNGWAFLDFHPWVLASKQAVTQAAVGRPAGPAERSGPLARPGPASDLGWWAVRPAA